MQKGSEPVSVVEAADADRSRAGSTRWKDLIAIALAVLIFSSLSIWMGHASESDLEADATTHFMMARYAAKSHQYFASVWGRPLCTAAYFLGSQIGTIEQGRFAARVTSLAMALFTTAITYLIAKRQDVRRPALVVILLLAQPIFFLHSFSELTEIPFDVVLVLAFLAYQRRQWFAMAFLTGMLPLGRPEGFGFILMAIVALLMHRRWYWLWAVAVPFIAWNYAGFLWSEPKLPPGAGPSWWIFNSQWPMWVIHQWPYSYESVYGHGNLFSFTARLPILVGPLLFPFTLIGLALGLLLLRARRDPFEGNKYERRDAETQRPEERNPNQVLSSDLCVSASLRSYVLRLIKMPHALRCEILIVLIPLSILVVHSLLWWRGKMGSDGELRYLVIVGPFFAIAAARGWEWVWSRYRWRAPLLFAGIAAALPIAGNFAYPVVPLPIYAEGMVSREVARWYQNDVEVHTNYPRIMPTPPNVLFYLDLSPTDQNRMISAGKQSVKLAPPGTLLIWDPVYGQNNSSADMCFGETEIKAAGWIYFTTFEEGNTYAEVYLSPKTIDGKDSVLPQNDPNSLRYFGPPFRDRVARN